MSGDGNDHAYGTGAVFVAERMVLTGQFTPSEDTWRRLTADGYLTGFSLSIAGSDYVRVSGIPTNLEGNENRFAKSFISTINYYGWGVQYNWNGAYDEQAFGTSGNDVFGGYDWSNAKGQRWYYGGAGRDGLCVSDGRDSVADLRMQYLVLDQSVLANGDRSVNIDSIEYICSRSGALSYDVDVGELSFNARSYLCSNADLYSAFGFNQIAAAQHWLTYGRTEGRSVGTFDALQYIASYGDVLKCVRHRQGCQVASLDGMRQARGQGRGHVRCWGVPRSI